MLPIVDLGSTHTHYTAPLASRRAGSSAIKIGCVGDSITAGVHSSNRGTMAYPAQLQRMIDAAHGKGRYAVTNLGACGSTVLKKTHSAGQPYWERPQYKVVGASFLFFFSLSLSLS